jgi:multidrug efflux pump
MISRFFIDRPVFATVLSILITLAGAVALLHLPLAQFPKIAPPQVAVSCVYPGASAQDVAEAVAAAIEQQVNGVEGMMYMSSSCANDGSYHLSVTFHQGVDLDMAQILVQNRVALAIPLLPEVIRQTGVTVRKRSADPLCGLALVSPSGKYDQLYLSNYCLRYVRDELLRVDGVSEINILGQRDYSLRIWVNPNRLAARGIVASELVEALRRQNQAVAAGAIGQPPVASDQEFQVTIDMRGRLVEVEEFEQVIVKEMPDGRLVRLKDVAWVELGAKAEDISCRFDRMPTAFMIIFQQPDANALETRDRLQKKMDELAQAFPEGLTYDVAFDTTPYTRESIKEVVKTLRDAVFLVALVVLLFLQNWRSAIIPLVAVPVAIVGTFLAMALFGFSLNNLTLFGLVLAIGIVVDDAIVVVEAVEHHIEQGFSARDATIRAMHQVSGPVIAVGLVLSAVFIPCAFISGITGQFFRQFAVAIAVSTLISAFNSLTLSPALTALLLRPKPLEHLASPLPLPIYGIVGAWLAWEFVPDAFSPWLAVPTGLVAGMMLGWPLNRLLAAGFQIFNRAFTRATFLYTQLIGHMLRVAVLVLVVYGGILAGTWFAFKETPRGFIPQQDMGYLLLTVQLPDAASKERTDNVLLQIEDIGLAMEGVRHLTTTSGQSFALNAFGPNFATAFVRLAPYEERRSPQLSSEAIAARLRQAFASEVFDATIGVFSPPAIRGVGRSGGFAFVVQDRGELGPAVLQQQVDALVRTGNETPGLVGLFTAFRANVPMLKIEADTEQCRKRHVRVEDFTDTLRVYQGSQYVNDFNLFDRTWQVIVQADSHFRDEPEDIKRLKTRNARGQMVPLGSLAQVREVNGPMMLTRYNMYPSAQINGFAAPGTSSRQAIDLMQTLARDELPKSMAYEWTDLSYLELLAGNTAYVLFVFAAVMVFLVLAAQYESWSLPLAVILVVPLCLPSAIAGVNLAGMDINIFTQIGFVVLVGLASKNAILIVEFAKHQRENGVARDEATLDACRLRLRPIVMTSMAFILGVVPLMLAHGAGMEMRRTLGVAVFSGMLGVTFFGLLLTPVFFYVIDWIGEAWLSRDTWFRRAADAGLDLLRLGFVRRLVARR